MPFKPYESKPITRLAFQIHPEDKLYKVAESTYNIIPRDSGEVIVFKAYQEPNNFDWVVRLTEEDAYHATDAVFRERNIVPE